MMDGIRACIFDLDGTLADSMWMWKDIDREYLARFAKQYPENLDRHIEGMSFTETAEFFKNYFSLSDSVEKIKSDWEQMSLERYANSVKLKPNARKLLDTLSSKGISMGIATSGGRPMVEAFLEGNKIASYFGSIVTSCDVKKGKPAPDVFIRAAKLLNIAAEHCLVFEDIPAGIVAGKKAGMRVCAVEDSFSIHLTDEKKNLADYYIKDFKEVFSN